MTAKKRKLAQLSNGNYLFHDGSSYLRDNDPMPVEEVIPILVDLAKRDSSLGYSLKGQIPSDDYSLLKRCITSGRIAAQREEDEKWIENMLRLPVPPEGLVDPDWEQLHRIALSENVIKHGIVGLWETFSDEELWHFVRRCKPAKSPLRLWRVTVENEWPQRKTEIMWAYNEQSIRAYWWFHYWNVISIDELTPEDRE